MDKIRAWLQDKKNLPIVAAGTAIIVVVVLLIILKSTGTIGKGANTGANMGSPYAPAPGGPVIPGMPQGAVGPAGSPAGGSAPGMPQGGPGMPPVAPGMSPGGPGMPPGPGGMAAPGTAEVAAPQPSVTQASALSPMLPYRKDPFKPFSGSPGTQGAKGKKDWLRRAIPIIVEPYRIAPRLADVVKVRTEETEVPLPAQPFRRMAGILMNGKISAILETNGEIDIVTPGMEITKGNSRVRVESISQDYIMLTCLDIPKKPVPIRVNMAGASANPGVTQTGPPVPGAPGRAPGMPPIPGMPVPGRGVPIHPVR